MEHRPTTTIERTEASKDLDHAHNPSSEHANDNQEYVAKLRPRFWASCLASYNNGVLYGEWIDANQHSDQLHQAVADMLAGSLIAGAEEFAIHDYEQFGSIRISEYESLETVSRIAQGLAEHGDAFGHWVEHVGTDSEQLHEFDEHYLGHWDSLADYAEHLLDDLGDTPQTIGPSWLQPYVRVDYAAFGRDLSHDMHVSEALDGGVHLFSPLSA